MTENKLDERLVDEHEAARILGCRPRSLAHWRKTGIGPRFLRIAGRSVRYRYSDLVRWIEEKTAAQEAS